MGIAERLIILAAVLFSVGCGVPHEIVTVVRCPTTPPTEIQCDTDQGEPMSCPDWPDLDVTAQLELLETAYLQGRIAHEDCRLAAECWRRRESVWQGGWDACENP